MSDFLTRVNDWVWSPALVYLCLAAGLFFTIRTRVLQVRNIPDMVKQLLHGHKSEAGVSSFQALAMSLAGRVGTGNIVGVSTAIAFGGPGAVFWMWMVAFFGASTAFVESTLGQMFKERDIDGRYRGGPAYYIEKSMKQKWYAILFAVVAAIALAAFLPAIQANSIAVAADNAWGVTTWVTAVALIIVLAFIIIGGVKRIATFAEIVVPTMALLYISVSLIVVFANFGDIPDVVSLIVRSAFNAEAGFGAAVGSAIAWGVKRGVYSNEAGQGTGPHSAAAAEVSHPVKQGYVQAFSVYIDTLFVCTATAFLILSTGLYNVYSDDTADADHILHQGAEGFDGPGSGVVANSFDSVWGGAGATFVAVAIAFFAFTTIVSYYYQAETNIVFLSRFEGVSAGATHAIIRVLQALVLIVVAWGATATASDAWTVGDIGVGAMAWLNIIAILIIQRPVFKALRDFERQKKAGLDPEFDPRPLGITGADFWEGRADELAASRKTETKQL